MLDVRDLRVYFHTRDGVIRAVDGVSFCVEAGETLGIAGESGSGKSVACYSLLGLIPRPPGRVEGGSAVFETRDLLRLTDAELRRIRGKEIAMIFQDPMTALNPFMTVGAQLMEPLRVHEGVSRAEARRRAAEALAAVGIQDGERRLRAYPHEFSGGMRQRVMIAMALITRPKVIIADEPTTALDVTVQAQILELIRRVQREVGAAVILVTHDLGVIAGMCDRVCVMYAGRIVERAGARELFRRPRHPYTEALLAAVPAPEGGRGELYTIPGLPPDLGRPMEGCAFAPRCAKAVEVCRRVRPDLAEICEGRSSACVRVQEGTL